MRARSYLELLLLLLLPYGSLSNGFTISNDEADYDEAICYTVLVTVNIFCVRYIITNKCRSVGACRIYLCSCVCVCYYVDDCHIR